MEVGRFAPTPSGRLHLGNLFSSLLCWLSVKSKGGKMILRIEDLDRERSRPEYEDALKRDLESAGLFWDEGSGKGGPHGPYEQRDRSPYYEKLLADLRDRGLVYPCFCSRGELHAADAPHASDGELLYSGKCRDLTEEEIRKLSQARSPALRVRTPDETVSFTDGHYGPYVQNLQRECGDFILRRSDGAFAYQLAAAADDAAMEVTQVVRGRDLLSSTPRQIWLLRLWGFPQPDYYHVPLLLSPDGRRLSKRDGDVSVETLLQKGFAWRDILGRLAFLAGLTHRPEPASPQELLPEFSWEKVKREDIVLPKELFQ